MFQRALSGLCVVAVLLGSQGVLPAEDPGEAELNKAIKLRLQVVSLSQLSPVIEECRNALKAGLKGGNRNFCQKLLVATLVKRGTVYGQAATSKERTIEQFRQLALVDLQAAVEVDDQASDALLEIGRLQAAQGGDPKAARDALNKAVKLEKARGDDADVETLVKALLLRAVAEITADPKQRLADSNEAIRLSPNNAKALLMRGKVLLERGKAKEALADLNASLKFNPNNVEALRYQGVALSTLGKLDEATNSFNRAIKLAPRAPLTYLQRGQIFLQQGKAQLAVNDFNKVFELIRPTARLFLLRADAYQKLGDIERTIENIDAAVKLDPEDLNVLLQAGLIYSSANKDSKAVEIYTDVIRKSPKNAMAYAARADARLKIGEHDKASADYDKSLKYEPNNTHVLNNLAWVLSTSTDDKVRDGSRAIKLANKACELTKFKEAHIVSTLAAGYAETGKFKTAIQWSQKAVELGQGSMKEALRKELKSYEAGKPWREGPKTEKKENND